MLLANSSVDSREGRWRGEGGGGGVEEAGWTRCGGQVAVGRLYSAVLLRVELRRAAASGTYYAVVAP